LQRPISLNQTRKARVPFYSDSVSSKLTVRIGWIGRRFPFLQANARAANLTKDVFAAAAELLQACNEPTKTVAGSETEPGFLSRYFEFRDIGIASFRSLA
jgi:hypothetical protein